VTWRLIPGETRGRGRPFWSIGRDTDTGIEHVLVEYSRQPRRWKSEQAARDHLATVLRAERAAVQAQRDAERAKGWPFPVSAHDWSLEEAR
jgi:hypothetical protein